MRSGMFDLEGALNFRIDALESVTAAVVLCLDGPVRELVEVAPVPALDRRRGGT